MSKITAMAYKNNVLTLKLNDGSVFLISTEKPQQKCNWGIFQAQNYNFIDSVLSSFDEHIMRFDTVERFYKSDMRIKNSHTITKLPDGNLERCTSERTFLHSKSVDLDETVECRTALNNTKHTIDWDFYTNHEAYRLDGCTLVVTHNNCTDFLY